MSWLLLPPGALLLLLLAVHLGFRAPRRVERRDPAAFGFAFEPVTIPTLRGRRLFGWLLPNGPRAPVVLMVHGWGGNAELMLPLARPFHRAGMSVLLIDARNHGRSDGDSFSSLPRFAEDVGRAVDWLRARCADSAPPIVLLGHSIGAGAVLLAASQRDDIAAVISVAAFAHPEWMMRRYLARLHLPGPLLAALLRYVEWVIGHRFEQIAPVNILRAIRCPVLLVHGRADDTVPVSDAEALAAAADVELLLIDGAGHDSVGQIEHHGDALTGFLIRQGIVASQRG